MAKFNCDLCDYSSGYEADLKIHTSIFHSTEESVLGSKKEEDDSLNKAVVVHSSYLRNGNFEDHSIQVQYFSEVKEENFDTFTSGQDNCWINEVKKEPVDIVETSIPQSRIDFHTNERTSVDKESKATDEILYHDATTDLTPLNCKFKEETNRDACLATEFCVSGLPLDVCDDLISTSWDKVSDQDSSRHPFQDHAYSCLPSKSMTTHHKKKPMLEKQTNLAKMLKNKESSSLHIWTDNKTFEVEFLSSNQVKIFPFSSILADHNYSNLMQNYAQEYTSHLSKSKKKLTGLWRSSFYILNVNSSYGSISDLPRCLEGPKLILKKVESILPEILNSMQLVPADKKMIEMSVQSDAMSDQEVRHGLKNLLDRNLQTVRNNPTLREPLDDLDQEQSLFEYSEFVIENLDLEDNNNLESSEEELQTHYKQFKCDVCQHQSASKKSLADHKFGHLYYKKLFEATNSTRKSKHQQTTKKTRQNYAENVPSKKAKLDDYTDEPISIKGTNFKCFSSDFGKGPLELRRCITAPTMRLEKLKTCPSCQKVFEKKYQLSLHVSRGECQKEERQPKYLR